MGGIGAICAWLAGEVLIGSFAGLVTEFTPPTLLASAADTSRFQLTSLEEPVLPFKEELQKRLDRELAKTGDIQVSLMWNNVNDLDLHCAGPDGARIFHNLRKSPTGGELDVDMNAREEIRYRYSVERLRYRITMVLDYSGSMRGNRLVEMKNAATQFVNEIARAQYEISVVQFESDALLAEPFSRDVARVTKAIHDRGAGGGTMLGRGMSVALGQIGAPSRRPDAPKDVILLFTDGKTRDEAECFQLAASAKQRNIEVIAIGAGSVNIGFLRKLVKDPKSVLFAKEGGVSKMFAAVASKLKTSKIDIVKSPDFQFSERSKITNAIHNVGVVIGTGWIAPRQWQGVAGGVALFVRDLITEGHSVFLASANRNGVFVTPPTTSFTNLVEAFNSITPDRVTHPDLIVNAARRYLKSFDTNAPTGQSGLIVIEPIPLGAKPESVSAGLGNLATSGFTCFNFQIEQPDPLNGARRLPGFRVVEQPTEAWSASAVQVAQPNVMQFTNQSGFFTWLKPRVLQRMQFAPTMARQRESTRRISEVPVENIYWPKAGAPPGEYRVEVVHFRQYVNIPTVYHVAIRTPWKVLEFNGVVAAGQTNHVHTFNLDPVGDYARWEAGQLREHRLKVKVAKGEYLRDLKAVVASWEQFPERQWISEIGLAGGWAGVVAFFIGGMLQFGQRRYSLRQAAAQRRTILAAAITMVVAVVGAVTAQVVGVAIPERLFEVPIPIPEMNLIAQTLGWPVLGIIVGGGMARVIPNFPFSRAMVVGAVGGVISGMMFELGTHSFGDSGSRFIGIFSLGIGLGSLIKITERLARRAALIVHWDPVNRSVINIGSRPVVLGSDRAVDVYLPREKGFPDTSASVTMRHGLVELENRLSGDSAFMQNGNKVKIGGIWIEIKTDARSR